MKYAIALVILCGVASASPPLKVENLQASSTITQAGNRVYSIAGTGLTSTAATVSIIPCSTNQVLIWNGSAWACSASVGITGAGTTNDLTIYTNGPAGIIGNYAGTGSVADKAITALSAAGVGTFQYFYDSPGTGLAVGATGNVVKLADTAVTPGTYALPGSLTIDQQGRITNAVAFAGSSPSACIAGSLTSQPTIGAAGALTNNCTTLTSAANSSGGGSSTTYLNGAGGWTTPPGTGVTGTGTTNTTVKYTNGAGGVIGNAWPTDDAITWGVASRFTITEANGNFRSFGTGTIDGAATLSSTATVATSLAVGTSSTAATIAEIRGSYDKTVANTGQLRIAETTTYRLSIGFDEAGGTAGVIDNSFADPTSEIDLRWANVNKAQFFGNGNLTLVGGLASTFMHASTDASVGTTLSVTGLSTLTGGFSAGAQSDMTSHKIVNLTNGSSAQDAAAFGQLATAVNAAVSGTSGTISRFTGPNTIGNSSMTDNGAANVRLAQSSGYASLDIGADTTLTTTSQNGMLAIAYTDGNNYIDTKTFASGHTYYRYGAGAQSGSNGIWLTLDNATGATTFAQALTASSTAHIVGALTEDSTASIAGALTLSNTVQATERIRFTGQEYLAAAHTDTNGPALLLMVNRTSDRRIALVDSANEALGSSAPQLQFGIDASAAYIDSGSTDAGTAKTLNINTRITSALVIGGGVTMNSTANVVGDFSVNTTSATIAASTGNTVLGGTLSIKGATMTLGTASINAQEKDPDGTQRPTIAGCGTSPTIVGSDKSGYFITGSSNTATCTITFHTAFSAASCVVFNPAGTAATATVPPVTATLAVSAISIGGPISKYVWECEDH